MSTTSHCSQHRHGAVHGTELHLVQAAAAATNDARGRAVLDHADAAAGGGDARCRRSSTANRGAGQSQAIVVNLKKIYFFFKFF